MATHPHDVSDLFLAPVSLAVDARLTELGAMSDRDLAVAVGSASDLPDWSREVRDTALLRAVEHLIELHGWSLAWDPRGIRLTHGEHTLVLGVPPSFVAYRATPGPGDVGA